MTQTTVAQNTRDKEIQDIWSRYTHFYKIGGGLLLVLIGVGIGAILFAEDTGYRTNVFTEILSVLVTIFVLDQLNAWRAEQVYKRGLIQQAGSRSNDVALDAVEKLARAGWLDRQNSLLQGCDLRKANLAKLHLERASLKEACLWRASFEEAALGAVNLEKADLRYANFKGADLSMTNFKEADYSYPRCQDAVGEFRVKQLKRQSVIFVFSQKVFPVTRRYCGAG